MSTNIEEGNQVIGALRFENTTLVEKVKTLEAEITQARSKLERMSSSKIDEMLSVQKSSNSLGYYGSSSSTLIASMPNGPRAGSVPQIEKVETEGEISKVDKGKFVLGNPPRIILILLPRRIPNPRDLTSAQG